MKVVEKLPICQFGSVHFWLDSSFNEAAEFAKKKKVQSFHEDQS
jgi:hypothetical protein